MTAEKTATRIPVIGETFAGDYDILEFAGAGGYARVYRALARHLDTEVAVKVLDPALSGSALDAFLQRFYREALLTSALSHPNTVTPIDYGRTPEGTAYIVMEFLDGESLADILDRGETFEPARVRSIIIDVLESLHEAHARGIVHADIKSSNIFLQRGNPNARTLDFGVAALIDDESNASQVFGTPHYIAPEAAVGNAVGTESDIYSLGITAYEMLHGKFPFDGESPRDILKAHVISPMPDLGDAVRNTPLGHFIERATAKSPSIRPTAAEGLEILRSNTSPLEPLISGPMTPSRGIPVDGSLTGRLPSLKLRSVSDSPSEYFDTSVHGRTDIAGRVRSAVARGIRGNASVVLLSGPAGVGKERVIRGVLGDETLGIQDEQIFFMLGEICITPSGRYDTTALLEQLPRRFDGFELLVEPAEELALGIRQNPSDPELLGRFADLLIAAANKQPFVWVLTALERADAGVSQLLSLLLDRLMKTSAPLSIVLAYSDNEPVASRMTSYFVRNVQARVWTHCEELTLSRLSRREMYDLAESLEPMADNVADLLVDMSEGNPGRLLWLLRESRERRLLRVEHGRLVRRLRADFSLLEQDLSRRAELRDRILLVLEEEDALAWTVALSLLGAQFTEKLADDLLRQLPKVGPSPLDALAAIVDRNILEKRTLPDRSVVYRFHHHGAVEALSTLFTEDQRRSLSMAAAVVLERDRQDYRSIGRAAELYSKNGDHRVAAQCAERAAVLAGAESQLEKEADYYSLALAEAQQADMSFAPKFLAQIEIGVARTRLRNGAIGVAEEMLHRAAERAIESELEDLELESHLLLAEIAVARGDTEAVSSRAKRMMQLARASDNPETLIRALLLVGEFSQSTGRRIEGARSFIQAEKLASEHKLPMLRARARMGIGRLLAEEHKWARAEELMQEAIQHFRAVQRMDLLIEGLVELGNVRLQAGQPGDALFRDAEKLAEEKGFGRMFADILSGQARAMVRLGELNAATILFLRAVERYRALGSRRGEGHTLIWLARTSLQRRQIEAARTYIVEALEAHRAARDTAGYVEALVLGAEVAIARRTPEQALEWAVEAQNRLAGQRRNTELLCRAMISEGIAESTLGRPELSASALQRAIKLATEGSFDELLEKAREALSEI